jgi:sugar phosphate permease
MTDQSLAIAAAPAQRTRSIPYKWELIVLLWLAYFVNRADRQIYSFVMPQVKADLHLSDFQLGLVATIFTWTYGLLVPLGGYIGDMLRRKWVIVVSLLLWSAATLVTGFSTGLIMLIVLRGLATGGGESFYYPSATSLIGQFHQRTRAVAMSVHQTALYCGVVVSGWIVGYLAQTYGWRHAFYAFGIAGIALALVMIWRLEDTPPLIHHENEDERGAAKPFGEASKRIPARGVLSALVRKPTVLCLALAFTGTVFVDMGYVTWMPTYLQETFNMSPASAGFSSMFYHHLCAMIGVMLFGRFSDGWSRRRPQARLEVQLIGVLGGAPFIWLMGAGHTKTICFVAMGLFGFFRGIYESNLYATLFEVIEPRLRSSAVGFMICFSFMVGATAPLILGAIKQHLGLAAGLAGLSGGYVWGAIMLLIAWTWFFHGDCLKRQAQGVDVANLELGNRV